MLFHFNSSNRKRGDMAHEAQKHIHLIDGNQTKDLIHYRSSIILYEYIGHLKGGLGISDEEGEASGLLIDPRDPPDNEGHNNQIFSHINI